MTNENLTLDVITRLKQFMEQIGVSVTQFADNTGIQRSSMSQILSGRNQKISIITVGKIHEAYPQLSLTWLLSGEGTMTTGGETSSEQYQQSEVDTAVASSTGEQSDFPFLSLFGNESAINAPEPPAIEKYATEKASKNTVKNIQPAEKEVVISKESANIEPQNPEPKNKRVVKIMIFYSDNTFETFSPDNLR